MVASAVGVLVNFNAFVNLEVVSRRVKTCDEVKAFGADDGVCWPTNV